MAKTNPIELVRPHLETIQKWVDDTFDSNTAMPSKKIGAKLAESIPLSAEELTAGFKELVKSGEITGIGGRRKIGYCRPDYAGKKESASAPVKEQTEKAVIRLGEKHRLCAVDARNWALQNWNGSFWQSYAYWGTFEDALKGLKRRLLNDEIKSAVIDSEKIENVIEAIHAAENRVLEALREAPVIKEESLE